MTTINPEDVAMTVAREHSISLTKARDIVYNGWDAADLDDIERDEPMDAEEACARAEIAAERKMERQFERHIDHNGWF